MRVNQKVKEF